MANSEQVKEQVREQYDLGADEREAAGWIESGGSSRPPESRSAHYFVGHKVDVAVAMSGLNNDVSVLEVGSSYGQMTFLLTNIFRAVTAVDLSEKAAELSQRRADYYGVKNVTFLQSDAEHLHAFQDNNFNGAFSFSVFRYIPNPEKALREVHRVTKQEGVVVVDFPNKYCPWFGWLKKPFGVSTHIHDRLFSAREVSAMMRDAGFRNIEYRHILFTPRRLPEKLLPLFKTIDNVFEKIPGINRLAAIIMVKGVKA